jgi:hypothetical protein
LSDHPLAVDFPMLVAGFREACARFYTAQIELGHEQGFHALFECVAWAGAVADRLRDGGEHLPDELAGLWFIRNLVLHRGVDAISRSVESSTYGEGTYGEGTYGGGSREVWRWVARTELPKPKSKKGLVQYDAKLAGRSVSATLKEANQAL